MWYPDWRTRDYFKEWRRCENYSGKWTWLFDESFALFPFLHRWQKSGALSSLNRKVALICYPNLGMVGSWVCLSEHKKTCTWCSDPPWTPFHDLSLNSSLFWGLVYLFRTEARRSRFANRDSLHFHRFQQSRAYPQVSKINDLFTFWSKFERLWHG